MEIFLVMISGRNWLCVHLQVKTWGQIATSQALVTWMISDNLSSTQSIPITDSTVTPCPPQLSEFEPGGWGMVWPFQRGNGIPRNWEAPHFSHQIIHKINFIHFPWPYLGLPDLGCPTNHQKSCSSLNQFTSLMNFGVHKPPTPSPTVSPSPWLHGSRLYGLNVLLQLHQGRGFHVHHLRLCPPRHARSTAGGGTKAWSPRRCGWAFWEWWDGNGNGRVLVVGNRSISKIWQWSWFLLKKWWLQTFIQMNNTNRRHLFAGHDIFMDDTKIWMLVMRSEFKTCAWGHKSWQLNQAKDLRNAQQEPHSSRGSRDKDMCLGSFCISMPWAAISSKILEYICIYNIKQWVSVRVHWISTHLLENGDVTPWIIQTSLNWVYRNMAGYPNHSFRVVWSHQTSPSFWHGPSCRGSKWPKRPMPTVSGAIRPWWHAKRVGGDESKLEPNA